MAQQTKEPRQATPGLETEMANKPDHGENSYRGYRRLENKATLITGADSGIGRAVAIAYAREGADVAISYLPEEEEDAQESARWVRDAGRKAMLLPGDIQQEQHCRAMVERVMAECGHIDILVNNAAHQMTHQKLEEFSSEEWDHTFRTNIYAMFYLAKAALPHMKRGSAIINTASVQAYQPDGMLLAYASTKGAIVTFTKALGAGDREGSPRQCRGAGAGLDAAHPLHDAAGEGREIRAERPHEAARPARRTGAFVRFPGHPGIELRDGFRDGPDGRGDAVRRGRFRPLSPCVLRKVAAHAATFSP